MDPRHKNGSASAAIRVALLTLLVTASVAAPSVAAPGSRLRAAVTGDRGVVASTSKQAAEVGVQVLRDGGNAMDAAIATTFAVGVTRPEMCGLGGGGFLVYRTANGRTDSLDFREQAPSDFTFALGLKDPAHAHSGGPAVRFGIGHQVIGVPGTVAGLEAARGRYGTMPLNELIAPSVRLAREGFEVTPELARSLENSWYDLGVYFPESRRTFLKHGLVPFAAGETMTLRDYASSLELIAQAGPHEFYRGSIAQKIVAEMEHSQRPLNPYEDDAGTITLEDMVSYEPIWREPLTTTYRGRTVIAAPAPTSGGIAILEMLNMLSTFDLAVMPQADRLHVLAETQKLAWADRNAYVADPRFEMVPESVLTKRSYGHKRARLIDLNRASAYPAPGLGELHENQSSGGGGAQTTHVSVIDAEGNAAAVTCSIEQFFGSHVVAPGTGIVLNSTMTDFEDPAVVPQAANRPEGGKRPRSSMSPTIVVEQDQPILVTGAAGGPGIPMAVLAAIVNMVDLDMDLARAIDAERVEACAEAPACAVLEIEEARISEVVIGDLRKRGHELQPVGEYESWPHFALAQSASVDPVTGLRSGYSDPREEWGALAE